MLRLLVLLALAPSSFALPAQDPPTPAATAPSIATIRLRITTDRVAPAERTHTLETCIDVLKRRLTYAKLETSAVRLEGDQIVIEADGTKAKALEESLPKIIRRSALEFYVIAVTEPGVIDVGAETKRLQELLAGAKDPVSDEAVRALDVNLPDGRTLKWLRIAPEVRDRFDSPVPFLLAVSDPKQRFGGSDFEQVYMTTDSNNRPAVGFDLRADRRKAFGDFTESNSDRRLAIALDDEVLTAPTLHGRIEDRGVIDGGSQGFASHEVKLQIAALRAGTLPVALERVVEPSSR